MPKSARLSANDPVRCARSPATRKSTGKATGRDTPFIVTSARAVNRSGASGCSDRNSRRMTGWRPASRKPGLAARRVIAACPMVSDAACTTTVAWVRSGRAGSNTTSPRQSLNRPLCDPPKAWTAISMRDAS